MRATLLYTGARFVLFAVVLVLLRLAGIGGLVWWLLALLISGLLSFVLLSRQRDAMSGSLTGRFRGVRRWVGDVRTRLDEGTRAEDQD